MGDFDVTRHKLVLGPDRDSTTGWYDVTYVPDEEPIEMIIQDRGSTTRYLPAGAYVRLDALGMTADPVLIGDKIEQSTTRFYEVKSVSEVNFVDSFVRRDCDLTLLPLHGLSYSDLTPTVEDARYRTKVYWDTYISLGNLNNHSFIVCYADPDYPLVKVFKTKSIHIIFAVDQPTSTPLPGHDHKPYGYEEHVPTDVVALNTQLMHLGGAELRKICEDHPEGSQRSLETMTPNTIRLGSHTLYSQRHILNYRRDTT